MVLYPIGDHSFTTTGMRTSNPKSFNLIFIENQVVLLVPTSAVSTRVSLKIDQDYVLRSPGQYIIYSFRSYPQIHKPYSKQWWTKLYGN
jgi:hypothetical protein